MHRQHENDVQESARARQMQRREGGRERGERDVPQVVAHLLRGADRFSVFFSRIAFLMGS